MQITVRGIAWLTLMTLAGIVSAAVSIYGIAAYLMMDLRQSPVLSISYCLLLLLCFPAFLLLRPARRSTRVLAGLAVAYVVVYCALNWRTCSELGYCSNILATLIETLNTVTVRGFLSVTLLSFAAERLDGKRSPRQAN